MMSLPSNAWQTIAGGLVVLLLYGSSFWGTFRRNPGNRLVECGVITVLVFLVTAFLFLIPGIPAWVPGYLMGLVF